MADPWLTLGSGLVIGLVSYRLWRLIAVDDIGARLRVWAYGGDEYLRPRFAKFIECPWCFGFWISISFALLAADGDVVVWALTSIVAAVIVGLLGERAS